VAIIKLISRISPVRRRLKVLPERPSWEKYPAPSLKTIPEALPGFRRVAA